VLLTLYSYSKALEYRFEVPTAGTLRQRPVASAKMEGRMTGRPIAEGERQRNGARQAVQPAVHRPTPQAPFVRDPTASINLDDAAMLRPGRVLLFSCF
jgi:hypothetical protein